MREDGKIFEAIPLVMADIDAVGKNRKNLQQNFNYRGIDDVMNAINPALIKHKVFIVPEVLEQSREERQTKNGSNLIYSVCRIKFRFCAEDGSYVEATTIGEGMDSGDKATNKAMAIAFKYACFQVFCIPTEEMKDPDSECPPANRAKGNDVTEEMTDALIDSVKITVIQKKIASKGLKDSSILEYYKLDSFKNMLTTTWMNAMKLLDNYPDKKEA
ncbi:MAG: ERF family protein [Clostridium sp.]|nr:ERF family protein [Clostridium sp.]MCM1459698.1 ERF family protein [Bacteroides sp.]